MKPFWKTLVSVTLVVTGAACDAAPPATPPRPMPRPVLYQSGPETVLVTQRAGPTGAVIKARLPSSSPAAESLVVTFPPGCLSQETEVTVSLNEGNLALKSGVAAGQVFRLAAAGVTSFSQPVSLQVSYDSSRWANHILVGYAIGPAGELSSIDSGHQDRHKGLATFYTHVPLLFTWAYVKP